MPHLGRVRQASPIPTNLLHVVSYADGAASGPSFGHGRRQWRRVTDHSPFRGHDRGRREVRRRGELYEWEGWRVLRPVPARCACGRPHKVSEQTLAARRLATVMTMEGTVHTLATVTAEFSPFVESEESAHERVGVTKNGRPAAVLIGLRRLRGLARDPGHSVRPPPHDGHRRGVGRHGASAGERGRV